MQLKSIQVTKYFEANAGRKMILTKALWVEEQYPVNWQLLFIVKSTLRLKEGGEP